MARDHKVGVRRETVPVPPLEENLYRIGAGAVEFGVEYRFLNDEIMAAHVATKPEQAAMVQAAQRANTAAAPTTKP